jgi:Tfp pilus assembly major pilin PilA
VVTDINLSKNTALDAEVIKKKMNKSLLFELFISLVPFVVSTLCALATLMAAGGNQEESLFIFIITWLITLLLSMVICFIIRIRTTLKAMNCCMEYFTENSDTEFVNKCSTSKTCYILSYIMPFIPVINIFTIFVLLYNLIVWNSVKNRINAIEYVKADPTRDINSYPSSSGTFLLIIFLIVGGLGIIGIGVLGLLSAIALPAYANYMARARFAEVTFALEGVKKQVELCIFDTEPTFAPNHVVSLEYCTNIDGSNAGNGWRLYNPSDYATKYVESITVKPNGIITVKARNTNGLGGTTYSVVPMFGSENNGIINWIEADGQAHGPYESIGNPSVDMTCKGAGLC